MPVSPCRSFVVSLHKQETTASDQRMRQITSLSPSGDGSSVKGGFPIVLALWCPSLQRWQTVLVSSVTQFSGLPFPGPKLLGLLGNREDATALSWAGTLFGMDRN